MLRRGVPALRLIGNGPAAGCLVTTVFDLLLAQYGVGATGLPGRWPRGYDDEKQPYTPAWQERFTRIPAEVAARVAREFASNAEATEGRSMIIMGAGINHWFNSDVTYRAIMTLLLACGTVGRNGGGWAHYVGQEKIRPLTGWATLAGGLDWLRPPRQNCGTEWYYLATDQWRYEVFGADSLASPLGQRVAARPRADRCPGPGRAPRLAADLPDLRPQPPGARRRASRGRQAARPRRSASETTSSAR